MSPPSSPAYPAELKALVERFGSTLEAFLNLPANSYEQCLARHSLDSLEAFYSLIFTPGLGLEFISTSSPPWPSGTPRAGSRPSKTTIDNIKGRLLMDSSLNSLDRVSVFVEKLRTRASTLPIGQQSEVVDAIITLAGEEILRDKLAGTPVADNLRPLDRLLERERQRLKSREADLTERRIKILEAKARQADQTEQALKNPELTTEQREARLREIFGIP